MFLRAFVLVVVVTASTWLSSGPALAQSCQAPPGTSAIDQYCEVIPDGAGGSSSGGSASGGPSSGGSASGGPKTPGLTGGTQSALTRRGPDGQAIVSLAQGTATPTAEAGKKKRPDTRQPARHRPDASRSAASSNNVLQAAASSAGQETRRVGGAFAVILLIAVIAMGGWGWIRFRRSSIA